MAASAAMRFDARLAQLDACFERTKQLALALKDVPGIRVNPVVPQANMLHLFFDASVDQVMQARDRIAVEEERWVINQARQTDVPGWSYAEIYVGDNLLPLADSEVVPYIARLAQSPG
jgi:hypothetical protein